MEAVVHLFCSVTLRWIEVGNPPPFLKGSFCLYVFQRERGHAFYNPPLVSIVQEKGMTLREGFAVTSVKKGKIVAETGGDVEFDECLWCTQAGPPQWLKNTGLPTGD